jgi:hypothetical protein
VIVLRPLCIGLVCLGLSKPAPPATIEGHALLSGGPTLSPQARRDHPEGYDGVHEPVLVERAGSVVARARTNQRGRFRFHVEPGRYEVVLEYAVAPHRVCESKHVTARRGRVAFIRLYCQAF